MRYIAPLLAALLGLAVALAGPAGAADPMPTFSGCGVSKKDPNDGTDLASDQTNPDMAEGEIEASFLNAGATPTVNLVIANLTGEVPPPATSITYDAYWEGVEDAIRFVRAHVDFSGGVVFEYGHQEVIDASATQNRRYVYDGDTTGTLFPGEHGVVQIAIPPEVGGKAGTTLKAVTSEVQVGRTTAVPGAINQSPTRGLSYSHDTVPLGNVTIGNCAAGAAPAPTTTAPANTPAAAPVQQAGPLPVSLVTKSVKRAKAKKTLAIKVKSTEALTALGARLSKGSKAFGTSKLSSLNGAGTFKLKLAKAIKKGTYAFDVAGTDASGQRRIASFKLKVK